jgi:uncharacterized protein YggL (DUF469 family)
MIEIFEKDINRHINGVIQAKQLEANASQTELEEYVLTTEVRREFIRFFDHYLKANSGSIGIWISGFFGSGKSHFLKMLSYLLSNQVINNKSSFEWFQTQIKDAALEGSIARAGEPPAEVMLFNIDAESSADGKNSRSGIVQVLQKVFDKHRGYFGADASIARFERILEDKQIFEPFKAAYQHLAGESWVSGRETWGFSSEKIIEALEQIGLSSETAKNAVAEREKFVPNSPKEFALEVKNYLEARPKARVVFMVDEVGQYIGTNSDLMLNLQTVVEELGAHNAGRAWIIVTSQEDLDSLIGVEDINNRKRNDFSKIQGRFEKPISLSSKNANEVIQLRLLEKTSEAKSRLNELYSASETVLSNLIRFETPMHLPSYKDSDEFIKAYPFIPYQFLLLQLVFTKARQMGASGKHLASGERSMLDGFKLATQALQNQAIGRLAPFHLFYQSISGFLEGTIKRVIERAAENPNLKPQDIDLLKTLFMIKYVDSFRANLGNLTTLSIRDILEDRIALQKEIEGSLARLESQTLIARNGDTYTFLTDEEQDVGRQIKNTQIEVGSEYTKLQSMIWDEVFFEKTFAPDRRHKFGFNRQLDGKAYGRSLEQLTLNVIPADSDFHLAQGSFLGSSGNAFEAQIILPQSNTLLNEIRLLVQTEQYLRSVNAADASPQLKQVIEAQRSINAERLKQISTLLERELSAATVQVSKRVVLQSAENSKTIFKAALEALIADNFTKFDLVKSAFETEADVDNAMQKALLESANTAARAEVKNWLERRMSERIPVKELLEAFYKAPFGWAELDILGIMAELLALGELELRQTQSEVVLSAGLTSKLRARATSDSFALRIPRSVNPSHVSTAREFSREVLQIPAPATDPKELSTEIRTRIQQKMELAMRLFEQAKTGLPYVSALETIQDTLRPILQPADTALLLETISQQSEPLELTIQHLSRIERFYTMQLQTFISAQKQISQLEQDLANMSDTSANNAVHLAKNILFAADPSKDLPRVGSILEPAVQSVNSERTRLKLELAQKIKETSSLLQNQAIDITPLENLHTEVQSIESLDTLLARGSRLESISQQLITEANPKTDMQRTRVRIPRGSIASTNELEQYLHNLSQQIQVALLQGRVVDLE